MPLLPCHRTSGTALVGTSTNVPVPFENTCENTRAWNWGRDVLTVLIFVGSQPERVLPSFSIVHCCFHVTDSEDPYLRLVYRQMFCAGCLHLLWCDMIACGPFYIRMGQLALCNNYVVNCCLICYSVGPIVCRCVLCAVCCLESIITISC